MNQTNLLFVVSIFTLSLSIYIFTKKDKLKEYYHHNSNLHHSMLNNSINNFTTNKFNYPAGPISNTDCSTHCQDRYNECLTYTSTGESQWCDYLKDECTLDCNWNSIFQ